MTRRNLARAALLALALAAIAPGGCDGQGRADGGGDGGPDGGEASRYVILSAVAESSPYHEAVTLLRDHRGADVLPFDPAQPEAVAEQLAAVAPDYVAVVLEPRDLDINLARRLLMLSTELDADPFSDFAYGFITGATAAQAKALVERVIRAEGEGIADAPLEVAGYAASNLNMVYTSSSSFLELLQPASYAAIYLETGNPQAKAFFAEHAAELEGKKLLDVGENGDPHMLWLFEGGNEVEDTWAFDPELVESPPVARLGLTSDDVRGLSLYPAVAFNGACHSGVVKRALVAGDILATFGDTGGKARFYEMSDGFSFALAMLEAGVTGYFAPIGANNANDKGEELYAAFRYDEPLGDIHKRTVDGVVMGFLGNRPRLALFGDGDSLYAHETLPSGSYDPEDFGLGSSAMLSGKANRIYFGDPLFDPFARHHDPAKLELVTTTLSADGDAHRLELVFDKPAVYFPLWDKFHDGGARIYTTLEIPARLADGVALEVLEASGAYTRVIHAVETHRGRTLLHVEVHVPDPGYGNDPLSFTIAFRVTTT